MEAVVKLKRWGNSLSVRIPAAVARSLGLVEDSSVTVKTEDGCVVVEPVRARTFDLDKLVAGITPKNCHEEADFGRPAGREAL